MLSPTKYILCAFGAVTILFQCSCGRDFIMKPPAGFVEFVREKKHFKAISADGIRITIKRVKNKPPDSKLEQWSETVLLHLKKQGYHILRTDNIKTSSNLKGKLFSTIYKYSNRDFSYLIAFFVTGKYIYLIESSGPYPIFQKHEKSIIESIKTFRLKVK